MVAVLTERKNIKTNSTDIFGSPDPVGGAVEGTRVVDIVSTAALGKDGARAGIEKVAEVVIKVGSIKAPPANGSRDESVCPHCAPESPKVIPGLLARFAAALHTADG